VDCRALLEGEAVNEERPGVISPAQPEGAAADLPAPSAQPRGLAAWLYRHIPALDSLRTYTPRELGADVLAGLTVATVAVPQAMAYATLAGLPPQQGLYTAIVMTAVGALLDSSRQLINGPTNAISIALLSVLATIPDGDKVSVTILFAFLVGLIQLGITFLRLGDLTRYVSHAVIVGFTLGAGILLVLDQLKNLLGLPSAGAAEDHFLKRFWLSMTRGSWHGPTTFIGLGTILVVLFVRQINSWLRRLGFRFPIPQHLVAVIVMAALVWAFDLEQKGVKIVGEIPAALPHFALPNLKGDTVRLLTGNAFAVAILGLLEAIAMAKSIAVHTGQKLDIHQQCLSEGMANLVGSFFQCMPGSGSLTRSAVNQQAGAISQWSGLFSAAAVAGTVLLFAPFARYIPRAALAGLLMLAAFRMVDRKQLVFHLRATRFDASIVIATALAAVFVSVEFCILIGVFLSFVLYVPRTAKVQLTEFTLTGDRLVRERHPDDPPCGRILIYSLDGELSFPVAPELEEYLSTIEHRARGDVRVVLLFLRQARNPDAAFLGMLEGFQRRLRMRGVALVLCRVRPELVEALRHTRLDAVLGAEHVIPEMAIAGSSTVKAVDRAYAILGRELCRVCPRKT
jgi:SulP family sulfate permease